MSQYSFNLDDSKECATARRVLEAIVSTHIQLDGATKNRVDMNQSHYPQNNNSQNADYQHYQTEIEDLKRKNHLLYEKHEAYEKSIKDLQSKLEEKESDSKQYIEMADKERLQANATIESLNSQIKTLQDEILNIEKDARERVNALQRKLNTYEQVLVDTTDEIQYFNIVSFGVLCQTNSDDALYQARAKSDGKTAAFQFNIEKGQRYEAINNREKNLEPFCDIIEDTPDANEIQLGSWGEAEFSSNGNLCVKKKAQIKLIKL
jgi:predicted RNase H-like nuclease (RuvC/YqgF family)